MPVRDSLVLDQLQKWHSTTIKELSDLTRTEIAIFRKAPTAKPIKQKNRRWYDSYGYDSYDSYGYYSDDFEHDPSSKCEEGEVCGGFTIKGRRIDIERVREALEALVRRVISNTLRFPKHSFQKEFYPGGVCHHQKKKIDFRA